MGKTQDVEAAVPAVLARIDKTIGRSKAGWSRWPGGWPEQISTALIDAVFSARAVYKTETGRGVWRLVADWRAQNDDAVNDLAKLAAAIRHDGPAAWAKNFGNSQHSPRRPGDAPGGPTKAAAVLEAAEKLGDVPIVHAADITTATASAAAGALRGVSGIGLATANYFFVLLGRPGVKPDRMILRFLKDATGQRWSQSNAQTLVTCVAAELPGVQAHELDHAIWQHESNEAGKRTG